MPSRLLKQTFDCSQLSFVSKILEKICAATTTLIFYENSIGEMSEGFKTAHSRVSSNES